MTSPCQCPVFGFKLCYRLLPNTNKDSHPTHGRGHGVVYNIASLFDFEISGTEITGIS